MSIAIYKGKYNTERKTTMNQQTQKYWDEISAPWTCLDVNNLELIMENVFQFANREGLGFAVTSSLLRHVLTAAKKNNYGVNIETLRNVYLVIGNKEPRIFSGVVFEDGSIKLI